MIKNFLYIGNTLKIIWKGSPIRFCLCILLLMITSLFIPISLIVINNIIKMLLENPTFTFSNICKIIIYGLILIIANSKAFLNILGSYLWITAEISMQKALIQKSQKMSQINYDYSDYYNCMDKAKESYNSALNNTMMLLSAICNTIVSTIAVMGYLIMLNKVVAIVFVFIILTKVIYYQIISKKEQLFKDKIVQLKREREDFSEYLTKKDTRILGALPFFFNKWKYINKKISNEKKQVQEKNILIEFIFNCFNYAIYSGLVIYLIYFRITDITTLMSSLIILFTAIDSIYNNIDNLITQLGGIMINTSLSKDMFEFLSLPEKNNYEIYSKNIDNVFIKDVSFKYPGTKEYALKNININIKPNEKIAIVGENGSGKTTLIKILLGLYEPTEGQIYKNEFLRNKITIVPQKFNLYDMSIKENIFISDITQFPRDDKINMLLDNIFSKQWIIDNDYTLNTILGRQFGISDLSGGDRQKLAIVRGCFKEHKMIVLDEPTAAIDPLKEDELIQKLSDSIIGKSAVVVTHRLSMTRNVDRIMVLNKGEIIEEGSYDYLMSYNSRFKRMFEIQKSGYVDN